jgi:predicted  nucleic acid-binding Zn-ribbon protein
MIDQDLDPQREKIYDLQQEIIRLRGQITYLQEELASAEDAMSYFRVDCERSINELEQQLGSRS